MLSAAFLVSNGQVNKELKPEVTKSLLLLVSDITQWEEHQYISPCAWSQMPPVPCLPGSLIIQESPEKTAEGGLIRRMEMIRALVWCIVVIGRLAWW